MAVGMHLIKIALAKMVFLAATFLAIVDELPLRDMSQMKVVPMSMLSTHGIFLC